MIGIKIYVSSEPSKHKQPKYWNGLPQYCIRIMSINFSQRSCLRKNVMWVSHVCKWGQCICTLKYNATSSCQVPVTHDSNQQFPYLSIRCYSKNMTLIITWHLDITTHRFRIYWWYDDDDTTSFNNKDVALLYHILQKRLLDTEIGPSPKSHHVYLHSKFLPQAYLI